MVDFPLGGRYPTLLNQDTDELFGLVDMHAHPMAHLGFGTELFYGPPDGDDVNVALANCNPFHGGFGLFDNQRGNEFRRVLVDQMENDIPGWDHKRQGAPRFEAWPSWHDRLHQHMWVDWIRRAWQGGLRVVVTLAVNSHCLADAAETQGPYDDLTVGNNQIAETRAFIGRHSDFMEIAETPEALRDIVGRGKLAVVLGVELDSIGNFYRPHSTARSGAPFDAEPSPDAVIAEIDRLHGMGVRYVFPVHLTDNLFGGAAVYERAFDAANRYSFGSHYAVEPAPADSSIGFVFDPRASFLDRVGAWTTLGFDPFADTPTPPPTSSGHRNSRGLTDLGRMAIEHLIDLGMIIDIDHMSERMVLDVLEIAQRRRYPLVAGHTGIRSPGGTERHHLVGVLRRVYDLGGVAGLGVAGGIDALANAIRGLGTAVPGCATAIGTDASGLDRLPRPRFGPGTPTDSAGRTAAGMVVYRDTPGAPPDALLRCSTSSRSWDYSLEGCAHYGLLPDMLEEMTSSNLADGDLLRRLFRSAEAFATTWHCCTAGYRGLDVLAVTGDGTLLHGSRQDSGWTGFGDVNQASGGGLGPVLTASCTLAPNGELNVIAVTGDGGLWHGTRHDSGWTGFGDVKRASGGDFGEVASASCSYQPSGQMHVIAVTRDGGLWHGVWHDSGWTGFGDVRRDAGSDLGNVVSASCSYQPGELLNVVAVTGDGGLWHGSWRRAGWIPFGDVKAASGGDFGSVRMAATDVQPDGRLDVTAITPDGRLWHGFRRDPGWTSFGDVGAAAGGLPEPVTRVACSYERGGRMNVLAVTSGGGLWHGSRTDAGWAPFGDVVAASGSTFGPVATVACA